MAQAKTGDKVKIHFTGKTEGGEVFASSYGQAPLEFIIGEGEMLPGIERAVTGMVVGEQKTTRLNPDEGYGQRNPAWIFDIELAEFPPHVNPEVGMHLHIPQAEGQTMILTVVDVGNKFVKVDANHPLAGEKLTFDLELIEITK